MPGTQVICREDKLKKNILLTIAGLVSIALACNAPFLNSPTAVSPDLAAHSSPEETPGWTLVFHDEFDRPELGSDWVTEYNWGRVNPPELQYYATDAFDFIGGVLRIKAEERPTESLPYTSGLISSFNSFKFTYGYVEARVKIPSGKGMWPAFWLLDASPTGIGEIDVMEIIGSEPNVVNMSLHFPDAAGNSQSQTETYKGPDYSKDFHNFAVDWRPDVIIWYVDGIERCRITQNIPQNPMYVIANLAVGGKWPGAPDGSTKFPAYYDIDYIRVYQQK